MCCMCTPSVPNAVNRHTLRPGLLLGHWALSRNRHTLHPRLPLRYWALSSCRSQANSVLGALWVVFTQRKTELMSSRKTTPPLVVFGLAYFTDKNEAYTTVYFQSLVIPAILFAFFCNFFCWKKKQNNFHSCLILQGISLLFSVSLCVHACDFFISSP